MTASDIRLPQAALDALVAGASLVLGARFGRVQRQAQLSEAVR